MDHKLAVDRIVDFHDMVVSKMFGIVKPLNVTNTVGPLDYMPPQKIRSTSIGDYLYVVDMTSGHYNVFVKAS